MDSRNARIYQDYFGGMTLQDVANKYGVTRQRVQQIITNSGLPKRPRINGGPKLRKFDYAKIAQHVQENKATVQATASFFGCSISTVTNALYSQGVTPQKQVRFTSSIVADIVSRYQAGEKLRLIGESYGTSAQYINTVLRRNGATAGRRSK
jgi:Mor family transcriptional regulator